jgi:hypothetical protein
MNARHLYLDLMKRCVMNSIYGEAEYGDAEQRAQGRVWPVTKGPRRAYGSGQWSVS